MSAADRGWGPGWPDCQRDKQVSLEVAGVSFPGGVHRDVAPIFEALALDFHTSVEPLVAGWCWGFACRAIGGTSRPSNHSWGLAVDFNAPRHPLGASGTFSASQEIRCRALASKYGCRWGGDYSRPDEMHFEFMGTPAVARDIIDRLGLNGPSPAGETMIDENYPGPKVVERIQKLLLNWNSDALPEYGADGDYGDETRTWVRRFQRAHGIPVSGTVDWVTGERLHGYSRVHRNYFPPKGHTHNFPTAPDGDFAPEDHTHDDLAPKSHPHNVTID